MKHVQVPPDGEVLRLDPTPADHDPLLPRSQHRIDLARARRCLHRSRTVAAVALAIWQS
jgi:hypothetical protein